MPRDFNTYLYEGIIGELFGCTAGADKFFRFVCFAPPMVSRSIDVALHLGVNRNTMVSRFDRSGLPSARDYLMHVRLAKTAKLMEDGACISAAARLMCHSSPQSFHRHIRLMTGLTARAWSATATGDSVLMDIRSNLAIPFRRHWRRFDPGSPFESFAAAA